MTGVLRVSAAQTPDGDRQVMTILPNGAQFFLPPAEALTYAFALLTVARDVFPTKESLDAAVPAAYDRVDELLTRSSRKELQ
jgi:hypothetical protein